MANHDQYDVGIVFLSGAGLDSWIWGPLAGHLKLPACYTDLPGRGQLAAIPADSLSLQDYVGHLQTQIEKFEPRKLVLVCHSIGALYGLLLAERLENRVYGIIHVALVIPKSGRSFAQSLPFPAPMLLPLVLNLLGTKPLGAIITKMIERDFQ